MDLFNKTEERQIYSVGDLNRLISSSLKSMFPAPVWVKGEVQRLNTRRSNYYFELLGIEGKQQFQIPVAALQWDRQRHGLDKWFDGNSDFTVRESVEVCLQCNIDFYAPFGKLSLKMVGLDSSFTLGQLEARRQEVFEYLKKNNLLELQKQFCLPELPLNVGLITSVGSAAEKDFMDSISASEYPFVIHRADCLMMGERMQTQMVSLLQQLDSENLDLIVITRGGGSRGDLSWFDQQDLAETIATLNTPVLTAIGHEIDTSIADAVANTSCKTPTAAAEHLVDLVDEADQRLNDAINQLLIEVDDKLDSADMLTRQLAIRLQPVVENKLHKQEMKLSNLMTQLLTKTQGRLDSAQLLQSQRPARLQNATKRLLTSKRDQVNSLVKQLPRLAVRATASKQEQLQHLAAKVQLLDPARLLARGYTITTNSDGRVICGMQDLKKGDKLLTRFRDGTTSSTVESLQKKG